MNIREIFRLFFLDRSKLSISHELDLSRNTVSKYINALLVRRLTYEDVQELSDHELYLLFEPELEDSQRLLHLKSLFPAMDKQLRKVGVDKKRLWRNYKADHPDGYGRTQFYEHFDRWKRRSSPVLRFEHKAGDKLFVDFTGKKLHVVDPDTGEVREVEVYVATLGASQLTYVEAVETQSKDDFLACVENSFHYMGGVPRAVVPDNLKSAVTKVCNYEPILNESFAHLLAHYGCTGLPARRRKPKDKALVEGAVKLVYKRIYAEMHDKVFTSLEALNQAVWQLLDIYNKENFSDRPYSRMDFFEEVERQALSDLPQHRHEPVEYAKATVGKNCHVHFRKDNHHYSVPYQYIGQKVRIAYTRSRVEVYQGYKLIAAHKRLKSPRNYTTESAHLPSTHRFIAEWSPELFRERADKIGADTRLLIDRILQRRAHPEQAYKSCLGVLNMAGRHGEDRLEKACGLALRFETYSFASVNKILKEGLDLSEQEQDIDLPDHGNIRGGGYYK